MTGKPIHVSDHCVLRYLERVIGIDVATIRANIAEMARPGAERGYRYFDAGDLRFSIEHDRASITINTVMTPERETA